MAIPYWPTQTNGREKPAKTVEAVIAVIAPA